MRLHTDFHDYYDHAVGYGIDENVHYNRFPKEAEIHIKCKFDFPHNFEIYLLGFCGQIYPMVELERLERSYDYEYDTEDHKILEKFYAFSFDEVTTKETEWETSSFGYGSDLLKIQIKKFFTDWSFQSNEIFIHHKVPIWIVKLERNQTLGLINPKLKDYGFERIKDSFTAFQEISMYLSNILVEQKEVVKIEDKYRIEQHGFDLKTSFRKEKKNKP